MIEGDWYLMTNRIHFLDWSENEIKYGARLKIDELVNTPPINNQRFHLPWYETYINITGVLLQIEAGTFIVLVLTF